MDDCYRVDDTTSIITPALVVFEELVRANLDEMIRIAGNVARLRPHCKTHKMKEVVRLQLDHGITRHKTATFAEAEMVVSAGASDVMLAYNPVGPNIDRTVAFRRKYPNVKFSVTADHPGPIDELSRAMQAAGQTVAVLLDIDSGQHRTGVPVGDEAAELYRRIHAAAGLTAAGLHVYDGQNHQSDFADRTAAVQQVWQSVSQFRDRLVEDGLPVPSIVAGGTGSFPCYAAIDDPTLQLSPGTCIFHDAGYGTRFPDLHFQPAALLMTRVVSRPSADRVTVDLGYKACASDPPAGSRLVFPDLPAAEQVLQNEEHLVLRVDNAANFAPGDILWAIPRHACPTSALHKQAYVVRNGKLSEPWPVAARDRWIEI